MIIRSITQEINKHMQTTCISKESLKITIKKEKEMGVMHLNLVLYISH